MRTDARSVDASRQPAGAAGGRVPGDAILHPLALASIALLLVNDHLLKQAWPGVVTGKLSDAAGLVFFPLLLVGGWEVGHAALRLPWRSGRRAAIVGVMLTGVVFSAVKTLPAARDAWAFALGALQWVVALPGAAAQGSVLPIRAVATVSDPTDMVALPALLVAYWILARRAARSCP